MAVCGFILLAGQGCPTITEIDLPDDVTTDAVEKKDAGVMEKKEDNGAMMKEKSEIIEYTKADFDAALASNKLVVLYFYANWCPLCRAEFPKMQEAFVELSDNSVVGFRVNFNDNETSADEEALAREYGVAYQHTKVFIKNGERVLKAPDSWDKERYIEEINKLKS